MRNLMKINDDLWVMFDEEDSNITKDTVWGFLKTLLIIGVIFFIILLGLNWLCGMVG